MKASTMFLIYEGRRRDGTLYERARTMIVFKNSYATQKLICADVSLKLYVHYGAVLLNYQTVPAALHTHTYMYTHTHTHTQDAQRLHFNFERVL